jgi:hypothetical protein
MIFLIALEALGIDKSAVERVSASVATGSLGSCAPIQIITSCSGFPPSFRMPETYRLCRSSRFISQYASIWASLVSWTSGAHNHGVRFSQCCRRGDVGSTAQPRRCWLTLSDLAAFGVLPFEVPRTFLSICQRSAYSVNPFIFTQATILLDF